MPALRGFLSVIGNRSEPLAGTEADDLRQRVYDAVDELKTAGALPERILVALRNLASDAEIPWQGSPVFDQIVAWTVDRYYRPPGLAPASGRRGVR